MNCYFEKIPNFMVLTLQRQLCNLTDRIASSSYCHTHYIFATFFKYIQLVREFHNLKKLQMQFPVNY